MAGLILSRRPGGVIKIGDNITVTLLEIRNNKARMRIEAPKDVAVDRLEVRLSKEENHAMQRPG